MCWRFPASLGNLEQLQILDLLHNEMTVDEQDMLTALLPDVQLNSCLSRAIVISTHFQTPLRMTFTDNAVPPGRCDRGRVFRQNHPFQAIGRPLGLGLGARARADPQRRALGQRFRNPPSMRSTNPKPTPPPKPRRHTLG